MKYNDQSLAMIYWEGEQYYYRPTLSACKCGSKDLDIDDTIGSCHSIYCNECGRSVSVPQIESGNPWLILQKMWDNGERE